MANYDVVVIGAGHNGLIAAAYLAKAGLEVCVVESENFAGGAINTFELTKPGFRHDMGGTCHVTILYNPLITNDELQLQSKFGLKYLVPEAACANIFPDNTAIIAYKDLDKTCQSIAQFSQADAETYRSFILGAKPIIEMMVGGLFTTPQPLGAFFAELDRTPEGQDLLKYFFMSAHEIVEDMFEHEKTRLMLTRLASEILVGPEDKGTGINFFFAAVMTQLYSMGMPEGGSSALPDSLVRCIESHGGVIRLKSKVEKIKVEGGRAKAVILASGEEIEARKAIVANLDPRLIFPQMVREVAPRLLDRLNKIKGPSYSGIMSHFALNEAPKFKAGDEVLEAHSIELLPWEEDFRRMFDELRYGRIPTTLSPLVVCQSHHDPTRAPDGKQVLSLWQFEPYDLQEGGPERWNDIKRQVADQVLEWLRKYTTNMGPDNIIARTVQSPRDFERWDANLIRGGVNGPGGFLYQFFSYRPVPELGQYRAPIERLYLSGQAYHPGGSITGAGRNTAQVVMEDLGIDFKQLIA